MHQQSDEEESGCCQRGESFQDRPLRAQACQCRGGLNDAPGLSPFHIPSPPSNRTNAGGHIVSDQNRVAPEGLPALPPETDLDSAKTSHRRHASSVLPSRGTQLYAGSAARSRGRAHNLLLCVEGESVGIGCYGTGSLRLEAAFCSARGAGDSRSCRPTHGTPPPPSSCRTAAPDRDPVWLV